MSVKQFQDQKQEHPKIVLETIKDFKPITNMVLCKSLYKNEEDRTAAGIYKVSPEFNKNEFIHKHVDRIVEVVKVPEKLTYVNNKPIDRAYSYTFTWKCDMDLKEGDICWVCGSHASNNIQIFVNGDVYELMNYFEFVVAKRRSTKREMGKKLKGRYIEEDEVFWEIIPLNGYILCEEVYETHKFLEYEKKVLDKSKGIVRFVGKPNTAYFRKGKWVNLDGDFGDIKHGDTIVKSKKAQEMDMHPTLEDELHLRFNGDKRYFYLQRIYFDFILCN